MDLRSLIAAEKDHVQVGTWSGEKLRSRDFPLSRKKGRVFPLTRRYRWQVTTFACGSEKYRLLVAYHTEVPEFRAILALDHGNDSAIIARWEFHGTHGGWHIHPFCEDAAQATPGIVKPQGTMRVPGGHDRHRRTKYVAPGHTMNDDVATAIVLRRFGVPHQNDFNDLFAQSAIVCL